MQQAVLCFPSKFAALYLWKISHRHRCKYVAPHKITSIAATHIWRYAMLPACRKFFLTSIGARPPRANLMYPLKQKLSSLLIARPFFTIFTCSMFSNQCPYSMPSYYYSIYASYKSNTDKYYCAYTMALRKCWRPKVDEYTFDSSEDEQVQYNTQPSILHPHAHIKSLNGWLTTQQLFYNMPGSPEPPIIETHADAGPAPLGDDSDGNAFGNILFDLDQVEENNAEKTRTTVELSACLICRCKASHLMWQPHPLLQWIPKIDVFLQELLWHEGIGGKFVQSCVLCGTSKPSYWCMDCLHSGLYCQSCLITNHKSMPFQWIQVRA